MSIDGSYKKLGAANLKRIEQYVRRIKKLMNAATGRFIDLSVGVDYDRSKGQFFFADYPELKKAVEKTVSGLASGMEQTIIAGTSAEWTRGTEDANGILDYLMKRVGLEPSDDLKDSAIGRFLNNHEAALAAFQQRKIGGIPLSSKVWNLANQTKIEAELARSIADGTSAATLAESMQELLNEPNKLFRRVRDEFGVLQLSKNARAYNPGAGVYRSSYKNALRLARTEINMAYRNAEQASYMDDRYVVGIEIKRSNNPYDCPVCEALKGRYPKDFKWSGWHPNCRCYMVPILVSDDEFIDMLDDESIEPEQSQNYVGELPGNFNEWLEANRERAKGWSSLPYFLQDNVEYVGGVAYGTYSPAEAKFARSTYGQQSIQKAIGDYLQEKYYDIPNTEVAAIYHYTRGDVSAFRKLNKDLRNGKLSDFNQAFSELLSNGLAKVPEYQGEVYRVLVLNRTNLDNWLELCDAKREITFHGFTSTSMSREIVERDFLGRIKKNKNERFCCLRISSKKGKKISEISQFNGIFTYQNQQEVLFDKGSVFKFLGFEKDADGIYRFILEEV